MILPRGGTPDVKVYDNLFERNEHAISIYAINTEIHDNVFKLNGVGIEARSATLDCYDNSFVNNWSTPVTHRLLGSEMMMSHFFLLLPRIRKASPI